MIIGNLTVASIFAWSAFGQEQAESKPYVVAAGTRIPMTLLNGVSSKNSLAGDSIYLETSFPIAVDGRIVIPPGTHVRGTVTEAKRPGKVKGRGEIYVRFDSLLLPNGISRDFRGRIGGIDGGSNERLDREEGKIVADGTKGKDALTIAQTAAAGAGLGGLASIGSTEKAKGIGAGAGAGAALGLIIVLLTRGPDATLARGSSAEMVLDRELYFTESDLDFSRPSRRRSASGSPPAADSSPQPRLRLPQ